MPAYITTAALREPSPCPIPAPDIFRERCEARAILVYACLMDWQTGVDGLQTDAERTGLIANVGQDAVQRMMAEAFAIVPRIQESKLRSSDFATSQFAKSKKPICAAASTLAAAMFLVRQNDPARLKDWLAKHSASERAAIFKHIHGAKP